MADDQTESTGGNRRAQTASAGVQPGDHVEGILPWHLVGGHSSRIGAPTASSAKPEW